MFTLSIMAATFGVFSWREPTVPINWFRVVAVALPFLAFGSAVPCLWARTCISGIVLEAKARKGGCYGEPSPVVSRIHRTHCSLIVRRVILALLFSAITTSLLIASVIVVGIASDVPHLTLTDLGKATTLSMFANGLPITPGGIGVGEAVFNQICVRLADPAVVYPYGTIFLAYRVISMLTACYGLIPFVNMGQSLYERRRGHIH